MFKELLKATATVLAGLVIVVVVSYGTVTEAILVESSDIQTQTQTTDTSNEPTVIDLPVTTYTLYRDTDDETPAVTRFVETEGVYYPQTVLTGEIAEYYSVEFPTLLIKSVGGSETVLLPVDASIPMATVMHEQEEIRENIGGYDAVLTMESGQAIGFALYFSIDSADSTAVESAMPKMSELRYNNTVLYTTVDPLKMTCATFEAFLSVAGLPALRHEGGKLIGPYASMPEHDNVGLGVASTAYHIYGMRFTPNFAVIPFEETATNGVIIKFENDIKNCIVFLAAAA